MTEVSCFLGTLLESPEVSAAFRCLDEIGGYLGSCSCNMNSSLSSWLACSEQLSILPVTGSLVIEFGGYPIPSLLLTGGTSMLVPSR